MFLNQPLNIYLNLNFFIGSHKQMWKKNVMYHIAGTFLGYSIININHMVLMVNKLYSLIRLFSSNFSKLYFFFINDASDNSRLNIIRRYVLHKLFFSMKFFFVFSRYKPGMFTNWSDLYSYLYHRHNQYHFISKLCNSKNYFPIYFIYRIFSIYREHFYKKSKYLLRRIRLSTDYQINSTSQLYSSLRKGYKRRTRKKIRLKQLSSLNRFNRRILKYNHVHFLNKLRSKNAFVRKLRFYTLYLKRKYYIYCQRLNNLKNKVRAKNWSLIHRLDHLKYMFRTRLEFYYRRYLWKRVSRCRKDNSNSILASRYTHLWKFYYFFRNFFDHKLPSFLFLIISGDCSNVHSEIDKLKLPMFSFLDMDSDIRGVSYPLYINNASFFIKLYFLFFIQFVYIRSRIGTFF